MKSAPTKNALYSIQNVRERFYGIEINWKNKITIKYNIQVF